MKKTTLFFILIALLSFKSFSQDTKTVYLKKIANLDFLHKSTQITDKEYVLKMDTLLAGFIVKKTSTVTTDSLLNLLSLYRHITFSSDQYKYNRSLYFSYLALNANRLKKSGEAFFYADKFKNEVAKNDIRILFAYRVKINHYFNLKNFKEIARMYEDDWNHLTQFDRYPLDKFFEPNRYQNLISVHFAIMEMFLEQEEFAKAKSVEDRITALHNNLLKRTDIDDEIKLRSEFYIVRISLLKSLKNKNYDKAAILLHELNEKYEKIHPNMLFGGHNPEINTYRINYYIGIKDYKKALKILTEMSDSHFVTGSNKIQYDVQISDLLAQTSEYKKAYEYIRNIIPVYEEVVRNTGTDTDELLYSHAEAEYNRIELQEAETEKQKRLLWIISISAASIILLAILYYLFNKEKRQLKQLTRITEIQIAEAMQRAAQEERRKIGQDLHDDLSGALATVLFNIEHARMKQNTEAAVLNTTYDDLQAVYSAVRAKSHHNFNALEDTDEDHLDESIRKIANTALNDSIKREIDIDKNASILLSTATRIEFLRIIQEAMANIVKHAKKVTEVFIYLYEDEGSIYLEIGDNGVPSNSKNRHGIGILSISERVKKLNGQILISNEGEGFHIEIEVPNYKIA